MSTLESACRMLRLLKAYRDRMTPEERAAYDQKIADDPTGIKAFFRPSPLWESLKKLKDSDA